MQPPLLWIGNFVCSNTTIQSYDGCLREGSKQGFRATTAANHAKSTYAQDTQTDGEEKPRKDIIRGYRLPRPGAAFRMKTQKAPEESVVQCLSRLASDGCGGKAVGLLNPSFRVTTFLPHRA